MRTLAAAVLAAVVGALASLGSPATAQASPDRVVATSWVQGTYSLSGVLGYSTVNFTLYADGRLFTPGGDDEHGVWAYEIATMTPSESRTLRRALARAIDGVDFGDVPVADVGYTRVRIAIDGRVLRASINALGMDTGLAPEQRRARDRLERIIDRAMDTPSSTFGPDVYEVRLITRGEPGIQLEWPGPALPAGDCGIVSAATYDAFPDSYRQGSHYTSGGRQFEIWTRPLLPGQRACPG
jgi:hypothetical protein